MYAFYDPHVSMCPCPCPCAPCLCPCVQCPCALFGARPSPHSPTPAAGGGGLRGDTTRHGACCASSTCSSPSSPPAAAMLAIAWRPWLLLLLLVLRRPSVDASPPGAGCSGAGITLRSGVRRRATVFGFVRGFGASVWLPNGCIGAKRPGAAWRGAW